MEYKNDDPKVRFPVPDKPTVRQQLEYLGEATTIGGKDLFLALWRSALILIEDWECKLIPDPHKLDRMVAPTMLNRLKHAISETCLHTQ